jgi:glutamate-1-semialdehyde 2,1-aminomutase
MDVFKPVGNVQHSGTFNAHLITVLAGIAFLKEIRKSYFYPRLQSLEEQFHSRMEEIIETLGLNMTLARHGARFDIIFGRRDAALRYQDTFCHDPELMVEFVKKCFTEGVYFHDYGGAPVHHGYSIQHSREDIAQVLTVIEGVLQQMKMKGAGL